MQKPLSIIAFLSLFLAISSSPVLAVPAFPGAEGFGAVATGGRGGGVYIVDSLADPVESGKTTLRDCIEDKRNVGARTCVFAVGGIIELGTELAITKPNITIAGQTAPGGGITLKAGSAEANNLISVDTSHVIIRYLRMRSGLNCESCRAFRIRERNDTKYVIVDHNTFSWSADELVIVWDAVTNTTLQWNVMADSFRIGQVSSVQGKGPNIGGYTGGGYHSILNNVIANMHQRNPRLRNSGGVVDVVNNLIYNPGGDGSVVSDSAIVNFINNYVKSGQDTTESRYINLDGGGVPNGSDFVYEEGTKFDPYNNGGIKDVLGVCPTPKPGEEDTCRKLLTQRNASEGLASVSITSPDQAYQDILAQAGASAYLNCSGEMVPRRDQIDTRLFQEIANNTGRIKDGINNTLGFVPLDRGTACVDTDKDGMPDEYEQAKGLNKNDANDGKTITSSGYSNLEMYLNSSTAGSVPTPTPTSVVTPSPTSQPPTPTPTPPLCNVADFNDDCAVNALDFSFFIAQFNTKSGDANYDAQYDLFADNKIDILDFSILIDQFDE